METEKISDITVLYIIAKQVIEKQVIEIPI